MSEKTNKTNKEQAPDESAPGETPPVQTPNPISDPSQMEKPAKAGK